MKKASTNGVTDISESVFACNLSNFLQGGKPHLYFINS